MYFLITMVNVPPPKKDRLCSPRGVCNSIISSFMLSAADESHLSVDQASASREQTPHKEGATSQKNSEDVGSQSKVEGKEYYKGGGRLIKVS